jgi:hypothetical protein
LSHVIAARSRPSASTIPVPSFHVCPVMYPHIVMPWTFVFVHSAGNTRW